MTNGVDGLSSFNKFITDLDKRWESFIYKRDLRLTQEARYGAASEKVAENILEDLFTLVLDWPLGSVNNQHGYADMVLTHLGIKRLIVEAKRPGSLSWDKTSLENALSQAQRYAAEQRVDTIAVSDGVILYAADIKNGGLEDRIRLELTGPTASPDLWWLSVDGIYREVERLTEERVGDVVPTASISNADDSGVEDGEQLLHPKYGIPATCFAYVGNPNKTSTWKLPCRLIDGSIDTGRLPGAIRAVVSNYRGAHIKSVPEEAIPDVLVRLGRAAWEAGKMPGQTPSPLGSYQQLNDVLYQLGRLDEIKRS